jgi:hypothetical protein
MTTQKFKVLGVEQGITITRPFNNEMFDHNEKVREIQTKAVLEALDKILADQDGDLMFKAGKICSGYGYGIGYDLEDIHEDAARNVETVNNNWMREDIWPGFLGLGLVQPMEMDYVGYKR